MSQQVYFAQEGMFVQFANVGYFFIYFSKNLSLKN